MGLVGVGPQPFMTLYFVSLIIAVAPDDPAVALEGEDVCGHPVKEPAVVADHHGAAAEIHQRLFECSQHVHVQVGFAQYHMVLFVLASYWMVRARQPFREMLWVWIALVCYFGWLSYFNVLLATIDIDGLGMQTWIGLPTFLLGCLLAASIVRSPAVTREELASPAEPVPG